MNKKGFTLVELIATIAIILLLGLIATPKVMDIINENRVKGYKEIERRLEEAAGKYIIENYVDSSLPFIKIEKNQLIEGKYIDEIYDLKDKSVCDAYVMVSDLNKTADFNVMLQCANYTSGLKLRTHIQTLYNDTEKRDIEGLEKTSDGNIRYTGNNVKNYVEFGNEEEKWRIIGIFEVKTKMGSKEQLIKIVRNDSIGNYSWDSSESSINGGWGINEWNQADLMTELNMLYLNQRSGTCYNGENNATTACDFSTIGISSSYRSMIEDVVWNKGALKWESLPVKTSYEKERGTEIGKICTSGTVCSDSVIRTTTWIGKVGLIYPSDYGYASTDTSCRANLIDYSNFPCKNNNWLHNDDYWSLTSGADYEYATGVAYISSSGFVSGNGANAPYGVHPTVYLKSNVSIVNGDGSSSNPYQISLNS